MGRKKLPPEEAQKRKREAKKKWKQRPESKEKHRVAERIRKALKRKEILSTNNLDEIIKQREQILKSKRKSRADPMKYQRELALNRERRKRKSAQNYANIIGKQMILHSESQPSTSSCNTSGAEGQAPPLGTVINSNAQRPSGAGLSSTSTSDFVLFPQQSKHPAPFPSLPVYRPNRLLKALPPKPSLKASRAPNAIILTWNMALMSSHAEISNYQLFAYQEAPGPVNSSLWQTVGDVKALPLPMACTLTQFSDGNRYYFMVRAVDVHNRFGPYSDPVGILFSDTKDNNNSANK